jgi:hypothetical protein
VNCQQGAVPANCDTLHDQQNGTTAGTPRAQDTIDSAPSTTEGGDALVPIVPPGSLESSPGSGNGDDNDSSDDGSSSDGSSGDE